MQDMITFTSAILDNLASFLGTEPVIYLFGMFLLLFVVKAFRVLIAY